MGQFFNDVLIRDFLSHLFSAGVVIALFVAWLKGIGQRISRIDENVTHMRDQHDKMDPYGRLQWYRDPSVTDILKNHDVLLGQLVSATDRQTRLLEDHDSLLKTIVAQGEAEGRQLDRIEAEQKHQGENAS